MTGLSLVARQRAIARVCFALEPPERDLEALGARDRWLLYRTMVRDRLRGMVRAGLPRTIEQLGGPVFDGWLDRWLAEAPPRTRYIRDVLPDFVAFALPGWEAETDLPAWVGDLARYETARWKAWYQEDPPGPIVELVFERPPVVSPSVQLLRLGHPVHRAENEGRTPPAEPVNLAVYRTPSNRIDLWVLNDVAADLLEAWQRGDRTITDTVRSVTQARSMEVGPGFVDKLSELIAQFLQRGILLGSRGEPR